mmetsp:Transcript_70828/g.114170  ORF Transcript_70828/g.114170 Transcript_70828/m.114170 type:complete len:94 (+) Transcript_70828:957-1238(+)
MTLHDGVTLSTRFRTLRHLQFSLLKLPCVFLIIADLLLGLTQGRKKGQHGTPTPQGMGRSLESTASCFLFVVVSEHSRCFSSKMTVYEDPCCC